MVSCLYGRSTSWVVTGLVTGVVTGVVSRVMSKVVTGDDWCAW